MEGKVLATLCAEKADGPFYPQNMANIISLKGLFFQGFEKIPREANTCLLTKIDHVTLRYKILDTFLLSCCCTGAWRET